MMFLETPIPYTTDAWTVYKAIKNDTLFFYMINMEEEIINFIDHSLPIEEQEKLYNELKYNLEEFYQENQANCHHYIGEFLIESKNHSIIVGNFRGFEYYSIFEISCFLHKLIKYMQHKCQKKLKINQIKVATLYNVFSMEDLEPYTYQEHNFLNRTITIH